MKKTVALLLLAALTVSLCGCGNFQQSLHPDSVDVPNETKVEPDSTKKAPESVPLTIEAGELRSAVDYSELLVLLNQNRASQYDESANLTEEPIPRASDSVSMKASADSESGSSFSGTNVQVSGIDEGDIVKTDGRYFYVLQNGSTLTIFSAEGENSEVLSHTELGGSGYYEEKDDSGYRSEYKYVQELYLSDGRLAAIGDYNYYMSTYKNDEYYYESTNYTFVDIYDVTNPSAPVLVDSLGQDGYYNASRMMNGKLYLVTNYWVYDEMNGDEPETFIPGIYRSGAVEPMNVKSIYICPGQTSQNYSVICSYDLKTSDTDQQLSLLGGSDQIYMSENNIYLFDSQWADEEVAAYSESVYQVSQKRNYSKTMIYRVNVADGGLEMSANGAVMGYMNDQFSADEYNGYLRIVTTTNVSDYRVFTDTAYGFVNYQYDENSTGNGLYLLDGDLNLVGSVEDLAEGEYVYSARFDGDIAYFCTYRSVDPLFAVDLSNPADPVVLSALKLTGFSEYLHQWDETHLFGFGQETDEETGWTQGLKLVMFDTADKTNVTVENYLVLDEAYSNALYNHKAFFIDTEKNLLGFCCDSAYYIYSYSPEAGFELLTKFWFDAYEYDVRGFWVDDWTYLVGREQAMLVSMNDWSTFVGLKISQ